MKELKILGINVMDRIKESGRTQATLTKHSKCIRTRWGFHELTEATCSRNGFIILELKGDKKEWEALENDLNQIGGIKIQEMCFNLENN